MCLVVSTHWPGQLRTQDGEPQVSGGHRHQAWSHLDTRQDIILCGLCSGGGDGGANVVMVVVGVGGHGDINGVNGVDDSVGDVDIVIMIMYKMNS